MTKNQMFKQLQEKDALIEDMEKQLQISKKQISSTL